MRPLLLVLSIFPVLACATPADESGLDSDQKENPLDGVNLAAGTMVLYEINARSANACDPTVGSDAQRSACAARKSEKLSPHIPYRAEGMSCGSFADMDRIQLGTLDDLRADTADYQQAITLRYVQEQVGANTIWMMPIFP